MRVGRLLRRVLVIVVLAGVALVAIAAAVSRTAGFRDWLRRRVVTQLNTELNGTVTIGGLDGDLFARLVFRDLRLASEGRRVVAVRRVAARYDLVRLLTGGGLVLRDVDVDGLALTVVEDARGWNLTRLLREHAEPSPTGTLDVVLADARVSNASIKMVRVRDVWRLRDARLTGSGRLGSRGQSFILTACSGILAGRDLRIVELTGTVAVAADGAIRVDGLHLRSDDSELRGEARIPGDTGGPYDLTIDAPRLAAREVRRVLRAAVPAIDLAGTIHLHGPPEWAAIDATVTSDAGTFVLGGNVGQGDLPSYDLRATLTGVNVAGVLGSAEPATALTGTVAVKGKGITPTQAAATVSVTLHDSIVSERTVSRLTARGDLAAQQVTFTTSAALEAGEIDAGGTIGIADEHYDLHVTARQLDPAPLLGRPDVHAQLNGTVAVTGNGFRPPTAQGEMHLALTPSTVEGLDVASALADVRATSGVFAIDRLHVDARALALDASGTLAREAGAAPVNGSLRYALRATDLAPLARLAGVAPLRGAVVIDGTASGSIDALALRATLTGHGLARADAEVGTLTATVAADGLGGAHGRAEVRARAEDVHALGRRFASVEARANGQTAADGKTTAHAEMRVQEDDRRHHELVADAGLTSAERRFTLTTLRLDLGDDTWRADGTPVVVQRGARVTIRDFVLRSAHGLMRLEGEAGTSGTQDLTVRVEGFDLAALASGPTAAITGHLSGTAHLGGTAQAPAIEAHAAVAAPTVARVRYESVAVDARVDGGRAAVSAHVVQTGPHDLTVEASSPLRLTLSPFTYAAGGALAGSLRARSIDLAFLDPLVPQVTRIGGQLDADLTLGGTVAAPEAHGPLAIVGGRAYVAPLGLTYDPIELRVTLDGPAATIETLRIASGDGALTGGGSARVLGSDAALDVRFQLDRFPVFGNQFGDGAVTGAISVAGTSAAPIVDGALTTNRFLLRIPETLPGSVRPPDPTIAIVGPGAPAPAATPGPTPAGASRAAAPTVGIYDRAAITIQVDIPRDAWIRRSDADIELRGWLTAWKKPAQPLALAGEIHTVRGWYAFQGRTFTIENGGVFFTGQDFDPLLELSAQRTAGDYTVRVKVGGSLSKPTLTLESEPSLPQADVLAVLLFGKPVSQLNSGESAGLREQAVGVASSYIASGLRESVADTLGLDTLQFETGSQGMEGGSLALGKYIAPDVFVTLAHRFARQGVQEIRVEYTVTPHWSVETSADTLGQTAIDVFWKNRY